MQTQHFIPQSLKTEDYYRQLQEYKQLERQYVEAIHLNKDYEYHIQNIELKFKSDIMQFRDQVNQKNQLIATMEDQLHETTQKLQEADDSNRKKQELLEFFKKEIDQKDKEIQNLVCNQNKIISQAIVDFVNKNRNSEDENPKQAQTQNKVIQDLMKHNQELLNKVREIDQNNRYDEIYFQVDGISYKDKEKMRLEGQTKLKKVVKVQDIVLKFQVDLQRKEDQIQDLHKDIQDLNQEIINRDRMIDKLKEELIDAQTKHADQSQVFVPENKQQVAILSVATELRKAITEFICSIFTQSHNNSLNPKENSQLLFMINLQKFMNKRSCQILQLVLSVYDKIVMNLQRMHPTYGKFFNRENLEQPQDPNTEKVNLWIQEQIKQAKKNHLDQNQKHVYLYRLIAIHNKLLNPSDQNEYDYDKIMNVRIENKICKQLYRIIKGDSLVKNKFN